MEAADLCDGGLRAGTPPRGGNGSFAYLLICWRTGGRFRALLGAGPPDRPRLWAGDRGRSRRIWGSATGPVVDVLWVKGDAFLRKIHSYYGFWRALVAHLGLYLRVFVTAGLWSELGHDAVRADLCFHNLNNRQFVAYFGILGYGAGRSMTPRRGRNQARARSDERCKGARSERAVEDVEGPGTERAARAGRSNALAGGHRQANSARNLEAS